MILLGYPIVRKPEKIEKKRKDPKSEEKKFRMELESKDWHLQQFDECEWYTMRAFCQDCYSRGFGGETSRNKGIRNVEISPNADKHNRCRRELHNLEFESNPWWCDPKLERGLFTWDWMYQVKGIGSAAPNQLIFDNCSGTTNS
eukprot:scaffold74968_cov57-Cyclotella_meneghiniana.AAC.11